VTFPAQPASCPLPAPYARLAFGAVLADQEISTSAPARVTTVPGMTRWPGDKRCPGPSVTAMWLPQSPEVAAVAVAVSVLSVSGQVRALRGLPRAAAFHRGGVDHPHVIDPQAGASRQDPDQPHHGGGQLAQPLAVPGLAGQAREQPRQVLAGMPQPPGFADVPESCRTFRMSVVASGREMRFGAPRGNRRPH
jgi:hypothetical protein